jgi:N-acetylneuraminate synthase
MNDFFLNGRGVGSNFPPLVIAEMSGNHNQSLERALEIVEAAANAGAHALKLQTYTADTMTLDLDAHEFRIDDPSSLWAGRTLYSLYKDAHTPWEWHEPIFDRARELGMIPFSTPFDESAVDFLETLGSPFYKIASFENTDLPLVRKAASTGKPLIISTGMASVADLDDCVRAARDAGCHNLVLLKCTSTYPATPLNTNLRTIPHLRELFGCQVGLSDHTLGIGAAVASIAMGATVIEKHFTLSRSDGGVDSTFSCEPAEMRSLVDASESAWQALGEIRYGLQSDDERKSMVFRRSLYAIADIAAGEPLTYHNVRAIRPGFGLPPKFIDTVVGMSAKNDIARGTALRWELLGGTPCMK